MSLDKQTQAVELLQELGLKEYEAKCLVALTRMPQGTAKEISEVTDVPRTRVYDAIRVLEAKGLVQVQHSSPRQFRAVSIAEVENLLAREYESRIETLKETLEELPRADNDEDLPPVGEIWSLTNHEAITARTERLIDEATDELILIISDPSAIAEDIFESVDTAGDRNVRVIIGITNDGLKASLQDAVPDADVFVSDLPWLPSDSTADGAVITRLLLADEQTVLVGSRPAAGKPEEAEQAIIGNGVSNGIVTILRYLLRSGILDGRARESVSAGSNSVMHDDENDS